MLCNGVHNGVHNLWRFDKSKLIGFVIRKENGSNNFLFLSCQMGLSDHAFFMIKHSSLPNGNHPISSPIFPMGLADTLGPCPVSCPPRFSGLPTLLRSSPKRVTNHNRKQGSKHACLVFFSLFFLPQIIMVSKYF